MKSSLHRKTLVALFTLGSLASSHQAYAQGIASQGGREFQPATTVASQGSVGQVIQETYRGREITLYVPKILPSEGRRALVVALHGGGGNGDQFRQDLNMDGVADANGFIVAYLNGTPASPGLPKQMRAWNAGGGCCASPAAKNVDDVGYITGATAYLAQKYGLNKRQAFVLGHSNGAVMANLLMCSTNSFAAAVPFAGTLNVEVKACPSARGANILAVHGTADANLPINGGPGTKGATDINWTSQAYTQGVFRASGAKYTLNALPGVDHPIANIDGYLIKSTGKGAALTAATFFGLAR